MASVNRPLSRRYGPKLNYVEQISLVVSEAPTTLILPITYPVEVNQWSTANLTLLGTYEIISQVSSFANGVEATLPALTGEAFSGGRSALTLPALTGASTGTTTGWITASMTLPALAGAATGTSGAVASAALTLSDRFSVSAFSGARAPLTLTSFSYVISSSGISGGVGSAAIALPALRGAATATSVIHGGASLTLPALQMAPSGQAWLIAPSLTMVASGHTVVAVTYEAYAINLATGAVTRYTNYPFVNILRYGTKYYGIAATGVYEIGGSLDITTQIDAHIKTFGTIFGNKKMKRVPYVYSSGRSDGGVVVGVTADEGTAYEYESDWGEVPGSTNHRTKVGNGIRGVYYAFDVKNVSGGSLELDSLDVTVEKTERAI